MLTLIIACSHLVLMGLTAYQETYKPQGGDKKTENLDSVLVAKNSSKDAYAIKLLRTG